MMSVDCWPIAAAAAVDVAAVVVAAVVAVEHKRLHSDDGLHSAINTTNHLVKINSSDLKTKKEQLL
jgi:hypothetical protein